MRNSIPQLYIPRVYNNAKEHGKLRLYLHRFGLTDDPMWPCEEEEQTTDHLMFQCKKLRNQRNEIITQIKKNPGGNWLTTNETFVINYLQIFVEFVKSLNFTDLQ